MPELQQLKEQAIAYYNDNKVPLRMQDVLNIMFKEGPSDVNGFVSTYFEELAVVPTITRVLALKALDSKGQPAILTKVYCLIRNKEQLVSESHIAVDTILLDHAKIEEKENEDISRENEIDEAINFINNEFRDILESANPRHQQDLDQKLYNLIESRRLAAKAKEDEGKEVELTTPPPVIEDGKKGAKKSAKGSAKKKAPAVAIIPDNPKEKAYPGWSAVTAVSQALCKGGAFLSRESLFDNLLLSYGGDTFSVNLPLPLITIIQSGKSALGKANSIKEFMIVPRPDMPVCEAIAAATKAHETIVKSLFAKNGIIAKSLNDFGAICPTLDKPEQGMDMIADALSQQGMDMGKDFFFVLNSSARECFDYEKGKYEVITGMAKSSDDMADYWADIVNRYPSIIGIIDPVRCEEKPQWNKICSAISDRCLIIADKAYSRPGLLKEEPLDFLEFATSGVVMRLGGCNTVTHVIECAKKMADNQNVTILAAGQHDTNDTTLIDVAIASKARYVKLGAPVRGERVSKYNRLLELEGALGERKSEWKPLEFPNIPPKPPTPTPEPEELPTGTGIES